MPVIKKIYFSGSLYTFQRFILGLARPQVPSTLSRIHPVFQYTFLYKGDSLYSFPLRLPIPPYPSIKFLRFIYFLRLSFPQRWTRTSSSPFPERSPAELAGLLTNHRMGIIGIEPMCDLLTYCYTWDGCLTSWLYTLI